MSDTKYCKYKSFLSLIFLGGTVHLPVLCSTVVEVQELKNNFVKSGTYAMDTDMPWLPYCDHN